MIDPIEQRIKFEPLAGVLKRASGDIEIRGNSLDLVLNEQLKHSEYRFNEHQQLGPDLWAVTGKAGG